MKCLLKFLYEQKTQVINLIKRTYKTSCYYLVASNNFSIKIYQHLYSCLETIQFLCKHWMKSNSRITPLGTLISKFITTGLAGWSDWLNSLQDIAAFQHIRATLFHQNMGLCWIISILRLGYLSAATFPKQTKSNWSVQITCVWVWLTMSYPHMHVSQTQVLLWF